MRFNLIIHITFTLPFTAPCKWETNNKFSYCLNRKRYNKSLLCKDCNQECMTVCPMAATQAHIWTAKGETQEVVFSRTRPQISRDGVGGVSRDVQRSFWVGNISLLQLIWLYYTNKQDLLFSFFFQFSILDIFKTKMCSERHLISQSENMHLKEAISQSFNTVFRQLPKKGGVY